MQWLTAGRGMLHEEMWAPDADGRAELYQVRAWRKGKGMPAPYCTSLWYAIMNLVMRSVRIRNYMHAHIQMNTKRFVKSRISHACIDVMITPFITL